MTKKVNNVDVEALKKMKEKALEEEPKPPTPKEVVKSTSPMLSIAVAGLEARKGHKNKPKLYWTFYNNCMTWVRDQKDHHVRIIDMRNFWDKEDPMQAFFQHLREVTFAHGPIGQMMISSHSDWEGLYLISKCRTELSEPARYILPDTRWDGVLFAENAKIWLQGCQTAGQRGERMAECICQNIADSTKTTVYGYACKAAQKMRNGGFYPVPDMGDYIEFKSQFEVKIS